MPLLGEVRRPSPLGDPLAPRARLRPPLVPTEGSVREGLEGESPILRLESLLGLAMLATPCAQRLSRPVPVKRPDAGRVFSEVCPLAADPPTLRPLMLGTVVDGVVRRGGTVVLTVVGMPKKMVALDFLRPLASRFSVESFQRPIRSFESCIRVSARDTKHNCMQNASSSWRVTVRRFPPQPLHIPTKTYPQVRQAALEVC